jgi:hypothetical protein
MRKHKGVSDFFTKVFMLLNVVGGSSKRREMIRDINLKEMSKALWVWATSNWDRVKSRAKYSKTWRYSLEFSL